MRIAPVLFALSCFLLCLKWSWHWPLVHDDAILHYVAFLMDHGMAPYRDIIDNNMPGAYMIEWAVIHTFGGGSLAWRLFDLSTMIVAIGASSYIAAPWDWLAGVFSGLMLCMFHMADGPIELGQRDWTLMVLVLLGYAFYLYALRHKRPMMMALFALAFGIGASIKPLAIPFPFALLLLACWVLRRDGRRWAPYLIASFGGACIPLLAVLIFLHRWHAFEAFFTLTRGLVAFYVGTGDAPLDLLLKLMLGRFLLGLIALAFLISAWRGSWKNWETMGLGLGAAFGMAFFLGQRKGFNHHKATLLAFVLLWIAIQFFVSLRRIDKSIVVGVAGLLLCSFLIGHKWLPDARNARYENPQMVSLERHLNALGGPALNGQVQCVETVQGCINDLYRMRLKQTTGFLGDFYLFQPEHVPVLDQLRARFLSEITTDPPKVLVLAAFGWSRGVYTYADLENWPAFARFLDAHYALVTDERSVDGSVDRYSYRIYVRP